MEHFFNLATVAAMCIFGYIGIFSVPIVLLLILYRAFFKRGRPIFWYLKPIMIPVVFIILSIVVFIIRGVKSYFFDKPAGISIGEKSTESVNGLVVHSEEKAKAVPVEKNNSTGLRK